MNVTQSCRLTIALLASLGLLVPQTALAAPVGAAARETLQTNLVLDVALDATGVLHGQVVNRDGRPLAQVTVYVRQQQRQAGATVTDSDGYFALDGLQGGIYQVEAAQSHAIWRVWAPRTAPPSAQRAAMIVAGGATMRGQGAASRFVIPTLLVGAVVATAIAIPVALNNADDDGS